MRRAERLHSVAWRGSADGALTTFFLCSQRAGPFFCGRDNVQALYARAWDAHVHASTVRMPYDLNLVRATGGLQGC